MDAEVRLVLVRHAIAEEQGSAWPDDEQRPLSRDGLRKWKAAARGLAEVIAPVDALLTSPLVRTCQTAEILAKALTPSPRLSLFEALRPDTGPATVISALRARSLSGTVVLVGHEPMLSELAAALLHLQGPLEFRKGAAMAIGTQGLGTRGPGRLEWFLTPRQLRLIGDRA
ncbi:phosphohistidine phosphatase SixA [Luteitalea sp. TBR-22]|uniref:SixA phosphatase family protein n=1 Tax=Luteitalea sp. TBR-22 TaxID=2802971 RepID=UPI001AF67ED7|nr:histidine phosphatase family protein [Luteitalea sp. TBR-22]BCS32916.1 phosphohistidine phosphatase SixA [Luteitalea sp. TBR-22]